MLQNTHTKKLIREPLEMFGGKYFQLFYQLKLDKTEIMWENLENLSCTHAWNMYLIDMNNWDVWEGLSELEMSWTQFKVCKQEKSTSFSTNEMCSDFCINPNILQVSLKKKKKNTNELTIVAMAKATKTHLLKWPFKIKANVSEFASERLGIRSSLGQHFSSKS